VPLAINTGNWMYFWPLELLETLGLAPPVSAELRRLMTRAMLRCHFGQALDLGAEVGTLPQASVPSVVATATSLKSGELTELAATVGAVAAGAPAARVAALARFGRRLGMALQMLDDLHNLTAAADAEKRHEDLHHGRPTWPWAWAARDLDSSSYGRLQAAARPLVAARRAGLRGDAHPLASALHGAAALSGRRAAQLLLDRALADLRAALPEGTALDAVAGELRRLEAAYA
jgi:geranylgeranyl pyrophosphate synthase